jgi:hypothetical protein
MPRQGDRSGESRKWGVTRTKSALLHGEFF